MIDIETHRVIDLISSRDCEEVANWLKSYPHLQVVSRDGSITYKKAITIAHPKAIQVSDRFHILKNLTSYCKDYLMKYFKPKVIINVENKIEMTNATTKSSIQNKKLTLEEKITKAIQLLNGGLLKSQICKQLNMDIRGFNKILAMNDDERSVYLKSPLQIAHEEKVAKKIELIESVRDMHNIRYSVRSISKKMSISRQTVTKYLDENMSAINGNYSVKRKSILDPFLEEINKLIGKGYTSSEIENQIRLNGYNGSDSTIRNYRARLKKSNQEIYKNCKSSPGTTDLVERNKLLKLLYKPLIKVKGLSIEYVNKVNDKYPRYKEIIDLVNEFRLILKSKAVTKISKWMEQASSLNNKFINSFINGITRDITAVKNAIIYDYNNGLAEGSVNKLKVIKRIMYGRNSFDMLYKKILWLEKNRKIN
jgi:transposase/predicted DNA-binding protein (UPF0251 family)